MTQTPRIPQSRAQLMEIQNEILLFAPDNFWVEWYDELGIEVTFESVMEQLRLGIDHVFRQPRHEAFRAQLHKLADEMYEVFKHGDRGDGQSLALDLGELITSVRA